MRKILSCFTIATLAIVLMAGGAWAGAEISDMARGTTFDDVVIAQEFFDDTAGLVKNLETGDLGTIANPAAYIPGITVGPGGTRDFWYTADLGLNIDWTLQFELTDATFEDANLALLYDEATNGSDLDGGGIGSLVKVGQLISGGTGESTATFIITGFDIPANDTLYLSSQNAAMTGITMETLLSGSVVKLGVTEVKTDGGTDINAAEVTPVDIITSQVQISGSVSTPVTSTIDVVSGRLEFEADSPLPLAGAPGTTLVQSRAGLTVLNDTAGIDDVVTLGPTDMIDLTTEPTTDFDGVDPDGLLFFDLNGDSTQDAGEELAINGTATGSFDATLVAGAGELTLVIEVDGVEVLDTRIWNTTMSLDLAAVPGDKTFFTNTASNTWNINGWQGTLPYMWAASTQAEDTFIKIFNDSNLDASVSVDVTSDDGTVVATVDLANIPAGQVGIFWAFDIATAAGIAIPGPFAATFTVNAATNSVTAMANQKRPGGVDRVVPVYHDGEQAGYKGY